MDLPGRDQHVQRLMHAGIDAAATVAQRFRDNPFYTPPAVMIEELRQRGHGA